MASALTQDQQALDLAVMAGEILLENGAEIFRVQETVIRILEACGLQDHHVYILTNGIIVTVGSVGERECHALRHVSQSRVNLGRIEEVNAVSREIAQGGHRDDIPAMKRRLAAIANMPGAPAWLRLLACGVGAAGFCYILGGTWADSAVALLGGFALQLVLFASGRLRLNKYLECILGALTATFVCKVLFLAGMGTAVNSAIVGVIIPLVPGVLITTAIRDFFTSDFLSGLIHIVDALLIAVSIAVGVGVMLIGWNLMGVMV